MLFKRFKQNGAGVRNLLKNLSVSLVGIVMLLVCLEVGLRLAGYGNLIIYESDENLYWKPVPNQKRVTKVGQYPIQVNSQGTRGREFQIEKPDNVIRILSVGDSRTFGWGLQEADTYNGRLEKLLAQRLPDGMEVEVINAGVNAWSYAQIFVYLRDIGLNYNPDVVLVAGANAWTQFSEGNSQQFIDDFRRRVWLKNILRRSAIYHYFIEVQLRQYYAKYRVNFIPVDPKTDDLFKEQQKKDPVAFFKKQLDQIGALLKEHNKFGLLLYIPTEGEGVSMDKSINADAFRFVSQDYGLMLLDFTDAFASSGETLYLEGDIVHPNEAGNYIIASLLADTLSVKILPQVLKVKGSQVH